MRIKDENYQFPTSNQLMKFIKKDSYLTNSRLIRDLKLVELIVQLFATNVFNKEEIIMTVRTAMLVKKDEIPREQFRIIEESFINVLQNCVDRKTNIDNSWIYPTKLFFMHAKL